MAGVLHDSWRWTTSPPQFPEFIAVHDVDYRALTDPDHKTTLRHARVGGLTPCSCSMSKTDFLARPEACSEVRGERTRQRQLTRESALNFSSVDLSCTPDGTTANQCLGTPTELA